MGIVAHYLHVLSAVVRHHILEDFLGEDAPLTEKSVSGFHEIALYVIVLEAIAISELVVSSECLVCRVIVVVQIGGPDQGAREADVVCPLPFLLECVRIIVRDPLISVPCHVLHRSFLVVMHSDISLSVVLAENILDFIVGKVATCSCAYALFCTALCYINGKPSRYMSSVRLTYAEWAAGRSTAGILESKSSTIEAKT